MNLWVHILAYAHLLSYMPRPTWFYSFHNYVDYFWAFYVNLMDFYNKPFEVCRIPQLCDLSSIPGAHIKAEEENGFYEVVLCLHICHGLYKHHAHIHNHFFKNCASQDMPVFPAFQRGGKGRWISPSLKTVWSKQWVPGQLGIHGKACCGIFVHCLKIYCCDWCKKELND